MKLLLLLSLFGQPGSVEYDFQSSIERGEKDGKFFVKAYLSLPYSSLQFAKYDSLFESGYHVVLEMIDAKKNVYGTERFGQVRVKSTEDAGSRSRLVEETLEVVVPAGKYKGTLRVAMLGATRKLTRDFEMELYHRTLGSVVVTNPEGKRMFSRPFTGDDTLKATVPVYDKDIDSLTLYITTKEVSSFEYRESFRESSSQVTWIVPLANFTSAGYDLKVTAYAKGRMKDKSDASFWIQKPFKYDPQRYLDLVNKLVYIADSNERDYMKKAPAEQRQVVWDSFWKAKDPTPQTEYNEVLENYMTKIDYCERNFGHGDKGYLSDRAKIYMRYGPPDEVEEHPFEMNQNPYIIWKYEGGLEFIFEDKLGFGQYELVYPQGYNP